MYQFSRSIYRELVESVSEDLHGESSGNRLRLLRACESAVERLAADPHYFAHPARTLFNDVRTLFPISAQLRVYRVIDRHMALAVEYVDQRLRQGMSVDGGRLSCSASTRKGTPCQRVPVPGSRYCPSHRHLDDALDHATAA